MFINIRVRLLVQLEQLAELQLHAVIHQQIVIPFTLLRRVMKEQALLQQALRVHIVDFVK